MRINATSAVTPALVSLLAAGAIVALGQSLLTTTPPPGRTLAAVRPALPALNDGETWSHPSQLAAYYRPLTPARPSSYTVQTGDTLSEIARRFYGTPSAWYYIAKANKLTGTIVSTGEVLKLPAALASYPSAPPPPAPPVTTATTTTPAPPVNAPTGAGDYSEAGLAALWEANGGSAATASLAACEAWYESTGNPNADNGVDLGLWQIDPGNEPGADLVNPDVNAAEAVRLSDDGTDWADWAQHPACGT
jgi:LysM domain/Lysozyme like domain